MSVLEARNKTLKEKNEWSDTREKRILASVRSWRPVGIFGAAAVLPAMPGAKH
jgi:hypothetical protein